MVDMILTAQGNTITSRRSNMHPLSLLREQQLAITESRQQALKAEVGPILLNSLKLRSNDVSRANYDLHPPPLDLNCIIRLFGLTRVTIEGINANAGKIV